MTTWGDLLAEAVQARPETPVRVKLANGQTRELASVELEWDVTRRERSAAERAALPEDEQIEEHHRLVGLILHLGSE